MGQLHDMHEHLPRQNMHGVTPKRALPGHPSVRPPPPLHLDSYRGRAEPEDTLKTKNQQVWKWLSVAFAWQEPDSKLFLQAFPQKVPGGLLTFFPGQSKVDRTQDKKGNLSVSIAATGGLV